MIRNSVVMIFGADWQATCVAAQVMIRLLPPCKSAWVRPLSSQCSAGGGTGFRCQVSRTTDYSLRRVPLGMLGA